MSRLHLAVAFSMFFGLSTTSMHAQDNTIPTIPSCVSDWACGAVRAPLGFYVDSITDDGRYVTLEDSTIWEVQPADRAVVAGWERSNFVTMRMIPAPIGDYEWQLTMVDNAEWRAAVRLVGRVRRK